MDPNPESTTAPAKDTGENRRFLWGLTGILIFAAVIQAGAIYGLRGNLREDPDGYRTIAVILRRTGVFGRGSVEDFDATAYRPPLYPLVLAGLVDGRSLPPFRLAALHWMLGLLTVALTAKLAKRLGASTTCSLLAATLVACDPLLLNQLSRVMTETLATLLATCTLYLLSRTARPASWIWAAAAGFSLGLAALCRPTFLPLLPLIGLGLLRSQGQLRSEETSGRWGWAAAATFVLAFAATVAPWTVRNEIVFGKPVTATTHGGYTLLLGNNPDFYEHLARQPRGAVWDPGPFDEFIQRRKDEGLDELELDAWAYQLALRHIRENPGLFAYASLVRIARLWNLAPHRTDANESLSRRSLRFAIGVWYAALFGLAAIGVWRKRHVLLQPPWIWCLAFCICFTAVHTVYWSNMRMRAPLAPLLCILAASSLAPRTTARQDVEIARSE